jgi:hypothetical protein
MNPTNLTPSFVRIFVFVVFGISLSLVILTVVIYYNNPGFLNLISSPCMAACIESNTLGVKGGCICDGLSRDVGATIGAELLHCKAVLSTIKCDCCCLYGKSFAAASVLLFFFCIGHIL